MGAKLLGKEDGKVGVSFKRRKILHSVEPIRKSMKKPSPILSSSKYFSYGGEVYERILLNKDISDPHSYEEAISDKDYELWISAIKEEIHAMHKNGV